MPPSNSKKTQQRSCLHCETESSSIQVRCDECNSYICNSCHWCHEFQANHEIRVCDRCDAFYCRGCDEMDQCDDCAEVVCGSCSTLLSCKFCGGGLCEECATACGRCGIVLCSRDAKFAVDCDTCRLSYCLVCLASGTKDPCVRCGHRPSKRMEQLVHLRLKSIYKAFKQNSLRSPRGKILADQTDPEDPESLLQAMAASKHPYPTRREPPVSSSSNHHHHQNAEATTTTTTVPPTPSTMRMTKVHDYQQAKAKADAAAAALLAELEEEEEAVRTRKTKKKKKKARQQARKVVDGEEEEKSADSGEAALSLPDTNSDDGDRQKEMEKVQDRKPPPPPKEATFEALPQKQPPPVDPMELELEELISEEDVEGLESFLSGIKGVPGRAMLRKNAKKAIKRFRASSPPPTDQGAETLDAPPTPSRTPSPPTFACESSLLRIVSETNKCKNNRGSFECVLHMAPNIVGWVIGKGGQRIRDLMEESGARIWIDQDNVDSQEPRVVYVSGQRPNVGGAVAMIKDLVERAPVTPNSRQTTPLVDGGSKWVLKPSKAPTLPEESVGVESQKTQVNLKPRISERTHEDRVKHVLTCEARFVPLLIGRRGWTIKNIQDTTGAKVDIDQNVLPRQITITGRDSDVQEALRMVLDVLSYPHAQPLPEERLEVDSKLEAPNQDRNPQCPEPSAVAPKPAAMESSPVFKTETFQVFPPGVSQGVALSPVHSNRPIRVCSPPSSLVVTGDVKGTVSASSSLSSTPEPSMSSGSRGRTCVPGAMRVLASPSQTATTRLPSTSPLDGRMTSSTFLQGDEGFGNHFVTPLGSHAAQQVPNPVASLPIPPGGNLFPGLPPAHGFLSHPPALPIPVPPRPQAAPSMWNGPGLAPGTPNHTTATNFGADFADPPMTHQQERPLLSVNDIVGGNSVLESGMGVGDSSQERDDAKLVDNLFGGGDFLLNGLSGLSLGNGGQRSGLWSHGDAVVPATALFSSGDRHEQESRFAWGEHGGN